MKNYTNKDIVRGIVVADGPETNNVLITKKATVYLHGDTNFANTSKYADSVFGSVGVDAIYTNGGNDYIEAGDGSDMIAAGAGHDYVQGGSGNDVIYGDAGNDTIEDYSGNNTIDSGAGHDIIAVRDGVNEIQAGTGNDKIYLENAVGIVKAGAGNNYIETYYEAGGSGGPGAPLVQIYADGGNDTVMTGGLDDYISVGNGKNYVEDIAGANTILSGKGNDTIIVGEGDNVIDSGAGNDVITTSYGSCNINSGAGNDVIRVGEGENYIDSGAGNDKIYATNGSNEIYAGNGNNYVEISTRERGVVGGGDANLIVTGSGNDTIIANFASNTIFAGTGNNKIQTGDESDTILVEAGNDTIHSNGGDDVIFANGKGNKQIYTGYGSDTISVHQSTATIVTEEGQDRVMVAASNTTIKTGVGADSVWLGSGKNNVDLGDGNDTLEVYTGTNTVQMGTGGDLVLLGQVGMGIGIPEVPDKKTQNTLYSGSGSAMYHIGYFADNTHHTIYTQEAKTVIVLSYLSDVFFEQLDNGNVFKIDGNDLKILSIDGKDDYYITIKDYVNTRGDFVIRVENEFFQMDQINFYLEGKENAKNTLKGLQNNDFIVGGNKNDILYGNDGHDSLYGGNGDDKLYGGKGENVYYFESIHQGNDTIYLEENSRTILDFTHADFENPPQAPIKKGDDLILKWNDENSITLAGYFKQGAFGQTPDVGIATRWEFRDLEEYFNHCYLLEGNNNKIETVEGVYYGSDKAETIYLNNNSALGAFGGNDKIHVNSDRGVLYFAPGDGHDVIYVNNKECQLTFNFNCYANEVQYERNGQNLIIRYGENLADSVTINGYYDYDSEHEIYFEEQPPSPQPDPKLMQSNYLWDDVNGFQNSIEVEAGCGTVNYTLLNNQNYIYFENYNSNNLKFAKSGNDIIISGFGNKNDKVIIKNYYLSDCDVNLSNGYSSDSLEDFLENDDFYTVSYKGNKINGTWYNDCIEGNDKGDTLYGNDGFDFIEGGAGNDLIRGGNHADSLFGDDGEDTIYGDNGNDYIEGGDGNDTLYGGAGDDVINGGEGIDFIYGQDGDDTLLAGSSGGDNIYGGEGNDLIQCYDMRKSRDIAVDPIPDYNKGCYVDGGNGNDTILCSNGLDTVYGGNGDDYISLNEGIYEVHAGAGDDYINIYAIGESRIFADAGNDMIIAEEVYDSYIDLGAGNDKVMIYAENTQVELGAGNDLVMIQGYDNYLTDNNGDDYYVVSRQSQYSVIYDTKGNDTVYIESERQNTLLMFNVEIDRDNGGKIIETNDEEANSLAIVADNRTTPISTYASNDPDVQMTQVYDFFGKGKIERIELAEGYYVEYRHVEAMRQEIAAWLYEYTDYSSVQDMFNNDSNGSTISEFHNLLSMTNWQKDFNMGSNYQYHSNNPT